MFSMKLTVTSSSPSYRYFANLQTFSHNAFPTWSFVLLEAHPLVTMPRRPHIIATVLATLITLTLLYYRNSLSSPRPHRFTPANATLGFGTIQAVSRAHCRRLPRLLWAANLTDLWFETPPQPESTDADVRAFRLDEDSAISEGRARAWLGHLHVLKHFL